jgi:hypothetical protein
LPDTQAAVEKFRCEYFHLHLFGRRAPAIVSNRRRPWKAAAQQRFVLSSSVGRTLLCAAFDLILILTMREQS